jgi:hypothetical protein
MPLTTQMKCRLNPFLPVAQIAIAIALGVWSYFQYQNESKGWTVYDLVPPAGMILHILNLPAALFITLVTRNSSFQIGLQHSTKIFIVYVATIGLMWLVIAWRLDYQGLDRRPNKVHKLVAVLAIFIAFGVAMLGVLMLVLPGPWARILPISAFVWAILLVLMFRKWLPQIRDATGSPSTSAAKSDGGDSRG